MTKAPKKVFAAILAMLMMISVLSVSSFAYTRNNREYTKMVLLGDSIGAGFSLDDYKARGKYCLQETRVEGSFGALVADALGIVGDNYSPLVSPGFRTKELRVFLENDYDGDFVTQNYIGALSGNDDYNLDVMKSKRPMYQQKVKDADIVMVEIGFNDTWLTTMGAYTDYASATGQPLVQLMNSPRYLYELQLALQDTLVNFASNFDAIVKDIYALNEDVTLVAVGCYNPFKDWTIPDGSGFYAGQLMNWLYNNMNSAMQSHLNDGVHDFVYVDVPNTAVISNTINDMLSGQPMLQEGGWDPHPTAEGHIYMANQILNALGA